VNENPNSVTYGRFQCLVALERFQCLVVLERRRKSILFTSFHFPPPNNFTETLFFPLILKFYFTMVLNCYFMPFLLFPSPIIYNYAS